MRMRIADLWASLVLAHTSTFLLVSCQYVGPFFGQRSTSNRQNIGIQQQPGQELEYSGKRASSLEEPTCEELRKMWLNTKRQSRASERTNELPVYRDPFAYNVWEAYPSRSPFSGYRDEYTGPARSRGAGGVPIYGKVVHKAPAGTRLRNGMSDRSRAFEELYGIVNRHPPSPRRRLTSFRAGGGGILSNTPQSGSFQHLKEIIISERARELQEQRRAEEMAARAAVYKEMTSGDRRQSSSSDSRNSNFLNSLQSYQDPKSYDFAQAQYVADVPDIGQAFSKADHYGREYMLR